MRKLFYICLLVYFVHVMAVGGAAALYRLGGPAYLAVPLIQWPESVRFWDGRPCKPAVNLSRAQPVKAYDAMQSMVECEIQRPPGVGSGALKARSGRSTAKALSRALLNPDEAVRLHALSFLGELGPRKVTGALPEIIEAAFSDESEHVRLAAIKLLGVFEDSGEAKAALLQVMQKPEERFRAVVADSLAGFSGPEVVAALIHAIDDPEVWVRARAAKSLGVIGDPQAVEVLIRALGDEERVVRAWSAAALKNIGPEAAPAVAALIYLLPDSDSYVRQSAAAALGMIGDPAAIPALILALEAEDMMERQAVIEALAGFGPLAVEARGPLLDIGRDGESWHSRQALWAVARIGGEDAIPVLLELLGSGNPERHGSYCSAARALGQMGSAANAAVSRLVEAVTFYSVRHYTAECTIEALGKIGNIYGISAILGLMKDKDLNMYADLEKKGLTALGEIGGLRVVDHLAPYLRHRNSDLRLEAAAALGKAGRSARKVVPELIELLSSENWRDVYISATALSGIGDPAAIPALTSMAEGHNRQMAVFAHMALAGIEPGNEKHVRSLIEALSGGEPMERQYAAWAMKVLALEVFLPHLQEALYDGWGKVRQFAADGLWLIGVPDEDVIRTLIRRLRRNYSDADGKLAAALEGLQRIRVEQMVGAMVLSGQTAPGYGADDSREDIRAALEALRAHHEAPPPRLAAAPAEADEEPTAESEPDDDVAASAEERVPEDAAMAVLAALKALGEDGRRQVQGWWNEAEFGFGIHDDPERAVGLLMRHGYDLESVRQGMVKMLDEALESGVPPHLIGRFIHALRELER